MTRIAVDVAGARDLVDLASRAAADLQDAADEAARLLARVGTASSAPATLAAAATWSGLAGRRIDRLVEQLVRADDAFTVTLLRDGVLVRLRLRLGPDASAQDLFALLGDLGYGDGRPPADPAGVRTVFDTLPPGLALRITDAAPQVVGALDGAPAHLRHRANRLRIRADLALLAADVPGLLADAQAILAGVPWLVDREDGLDVLLATAPERLTAAQAARLVDLVHTVPELWWPEHLQPGFGEPLPDFAAAAAGRHRMDRLTALLGDRDLTILGYDGAGDGRLIVALGDVERAEVISTVIPGTGTTLDGLHASSDYRAYVANLQRELGGDHATVLWFDFDAPNDVLPGAARARYADDAALRLPTFTEGLAVANGARQVVFGHSYGGVVLATAGPELHAVDTVVALGAPGLRVLGTQAPPFPDGTRVVAATYPRDPILYATIVPRWGIDPVQHRDVDIVDLTTIDQSGKSAVQRHMDYLLDDVSLAIFGAVVRGEDVELRHAGSSGER